MTTPHGSVLVGYDGSADAELALSWADELARSQHRALHVLLSEVDVTSVLRTTREQHLKKLAGLKSDVEARLRGSQAPATSWEVVDVSPAEALIGASTVAALVVLGAQGHGPIAGAVLGSVSQHVTRHAACPVVVTRHPYDPRSRRVVVGVDGSGGSRHALTFGLDYADRIGGSLTVVHAWRNLARSGAVASGYPTDSLVDEIRAAERIIGESVAGLTERYPDVEVVQEAIPVAPTRALADASQRACLLVVGSRGLGTFAQVLLGSVSQSVLHHAQCSVAVVR